VADEWRTIDDDWLHPGESLALVMDKFTNSSSLVLAFELVDSGKVLLFVADAQTGNWASWQDVKWKDEAISTDELLARTAVFYKVGHHASHNATLVGVFEKMSSPDLCALIPVRKQDPNIKKKNGWKMPATNLFTRSPNARRTACCRWTASIPRTATRRWIRARRRGRPSISSR
jgi:hypothetical protein